MKPIHRTSRPLDRRTFLQVATGAAPAAALGKIAARDLEQLAVRLQVSAQRVSAQLKAHPELARPREVTRSVAELVERFSTRPPTGVLWADDGPAFDVNPVTGELRVNVIEARGLESAILEGHLAREAAHLLQATQRPASGKLPAGARGAPTLEVLTELVRRNGPGYAVEAWGDDAERLALKRGIVLEVEREVDPTLMELGYRLQQAKDADQTLAEHLLGAFRVKDVRQLPNEMRELLALHGTPPVTLTQLRLRLFRNKLHPAIQDAARQAAQYEGFSGLNQLDDWLTGVFQAHLPARRR